MSQLVFAFPAARPAVSIWAQPSPVAPPSDRVVAAVLQFGDVWDEREDGLTLIRFTPERLAMGDMRELLGSETARAEDVSILWDDREEQLVRVIDTAPLRAASDERPTGNAYADARMRGYRRYRPELELIEDWAA